MSKAKTTKFNSRYFKGCLRYLEMSEKDLCHAIGITPTHLSRVVKSGVITEELLLRISKELDVRPDFFTYGPFDEETDLDTDTMTFRAWEQAKAWDRKEEIIDAFLLLTDSSFYLNEKFKNASSKEQTDIIDLLGMVCSYCLYKDNIFGKRPQLNDIVSFLKSFNAP